MVSLCNLFLLHTCRSYGGLWQFIVNKHTQATGKLSLVVLEELLNIIKVTQFPAIYAGDKMISITSPTCKMMRYEAAVSSWATSSARMKSCLGLPAAEKR